MDIWQFISQNWHELFFLFGQHAYIVGIAIVIAIVTGVPIGIWISFNKKAAEIVLYIAGIIMTVPSIALFGIMIPVLSVFGHGIGSVPGL